PMGGHRTAVDDTSTYAPTFRASITQRGTGCGGIPPLEFVGLPILGSIEFGLRTPLPPQWRLPTVAAFATAPRTPPLQLGPCRLHLASPLLTIVRTTPATSIPLPIPNDLGLRGLTLDMQLIQSEHVPGSGFAGFGFSSAYRIMIGD